MCVPSNTASSLVVVSYVGGDEMLYVDVCLYVDNRRLVLFL